MGPACEQQVEGRAHLLGLGLAHRVVLRMPPPLATPLVMLSLVS
jgi:hypothetical protein